MSDFIQSGWSVFIAAFTIIGIMVCIWLLLSQSKKSVGIDIDSNQIENNQVWDENLTELNNPLPRWWMWMFLISCLFGIGYLFLYPGLGSYPGRLNYSGQAEHQASVDEASVALKPIYERFASMTIEQVAKDTQAKEIGQRLFLTYCAQCHGSDAGGSTGFPNLTDQDFLYGGNIQAIETTIHKGRIAVMPSFVGIGDEKIIDLVSYLKNYSSSSRNQEQDQRGGLAFQQFCSACHGIDAKGNQILGAPNLTDDIWLYGGSEKSLKESIRNGRNGMMPAHENTISLEKMKILTAYVWSLSNQSKPEILERIQSNIPK